MTTIAVLSLFAVLACFVPLALADCSTPGCFGGDVCCGSTRGRCITDPVNVTNTVCVCQDDYKGPTCAEQRKLARYAVPLTIFFGTFGFDCFYLGRTGEGIAKLFFGLSSVTILLSILMTANIIIGLTVLRTTNSMWYLPALLLVIIIIAFGIVGFLLWLVYAIKIISGVLPDAAGYALSWTWF
jgi:hypothetical protein